MKHGIIFQGDSLEILKKFKANSIDTVITDPPYGLSKHNINLIKETLEQWLKGNENYIPKTKGFMEKTWDSFVPPPALWKEVYRVLKPGGTILVFAGTRTYDLMTLSIRLAGFEIKDTLMWLYGSGMPKSQSISKMIDKKLGKKGKVIGYRNDGKGTNSGSGIYNMNNKDSKMTKNFPIIEPESEEAKRWQGLNTHGLKPAYEPIIMAIKPNDGSYAENALRWNVAGLNVSEARIGDEEISVHDAPSGTFAGGEQNRGSIKNYRTKKGRFPANILLDEEAAKMLGKQARFFYVAKASKKERKGNTHPTVKPIKLLEYLVKLTSMPNENQIYLDPFLGSGTTAVACENLGKKWVGIEINPEYCKIAKERLLNELER